MENLSFIRPETIEDRRKENKEWEIKERTKAILFSIQTRLTWKDIEPETHQTEGNVQLIYTFNISPDRPFPDEAITRATAVILKNGWSACAITKITGSAKYKVRITTENLVVKDESKFYDGFEPDKKIVFL